MTFGRGVRQGLLVPTMLALAAFLAFAGLGYWQIERKAWKEGLIETLGRRLAAPPIALPPAQRWASMDADADEFRRVSMTAELVPGQEALVFTSGSALRSDVSGPGYWVLAPVRLADGGLVVVDRGFIPDGAQDPAMHPAASGPIRMTGVVRWPEPRGLFTPKDSAMLFFTRDPIAIAIAKGWGSVAPFYIELETATGPGALPRAGRVTASLRNEHLQYALTWFGLAAVTAVAFAFWVRSRRREIGV